MKKPSKKIDKKVEKDVSNNSSTNFSNRNLVLLESTFLKSGRNNGKNKIEVANALNNYRRKTMVKRSKRSLDKKKSNYFEEKVPLSKRLYRHPKLSYEEQKNHSFQDTFDSLQSKTTMKPLLKESNKHTYVSSNEYFEMQKSLENTKDDKNMLNEAIKDTNTSQSLVKRQNRRNYINIQDHQKTVNNGTSADILEYDPNKIPYVEVPDYSDIREESLDEKDRRMKEEKNDDFIDPEISTNSEEDSWKGSRRDSIKENDTNFTNFKTYTDIKRLNNNNNNNNNDDNNKPDNLKKPERSNDFKDSCERLKSDKFEGSKGGGLLKNSNELRSNEDNLNNSNVDKGAGENSEENHGPPTEDPGETREDTGSRSGPIIFDINEYRKPFDLDEFLKDDPIMKKLKLLEKETRANYGQNGKRVSADESESDNAFREQANGQRNCAEVQHTFDHLPKSRESSKVFAKVDEKKDEEKDGTRSEKINNREDSNEENEHFLRFVFEKRDDRLPGFENEEKSRYFVSGDAIRNLEGDIGKDRKRKDRSRKEDVYEALSAILGEKSRVSRLDEAERIGDEPALEYKNFWSLEYKSPRVDMEAQERRK